MTALSSALYNSWHKETTVEAEYLISELSATTEYELLASLISVWLFLRLYSYGICLMGRFAGYELK